MCLFALIVDLDGVDFGELIPEYFSLFVIGITLLLDNDELVLELTFVCLLLFVFMDHVLKAEGGVHSRFMFYHL